MPAVIDRRLATLVACAVWSAPASANPVPSALRAPRAAEVIGRVAVEADLSRYRSLAPLSLAPDLVFGITDRVGGALHYSRLSHQTFGAGNGLCLRASRETLDEAPPTCEHVQTGFGASILVRGPGTLVSRAGLVQHAGAFGVEVGATKVWSSGASWLAIAPGLVVGLTDREDGNRDRLSAPIYVGRGFASSELHLRSGLTGALDTFGETFAVPLGIGGSIGYRSVRLGGELTLDRAFGQQNGRFYRSAFVYFEVSRRATR